MASRLGADAETSGRRLPAAGVSGLSLVRPDEPRFGEGVSGHGRFDVHVARSILQRNRLVHGEQPEDVMMRGVAWWRRWSQVP